MKIFPEIDYLIELNNDSMSTLYRVKKTDFIKRTVRSKWNNQTFIGEIIENEFEIKLSKSC
jgi:hypothetical protein